MTNIFNSPIYRISPYTTYNSLSNLGVSNVDYSALEIKEDYFECFYDSGRNALSDALKSCQLNCEDEVLIITSSNCDYVSSCVTKTIEVHCKWTRVFDAKVKCIIIIHEFGKYCSFDYEKIPEGCVVIEDYAHSAWALKKESVIKADFAIFSLSKFLNIKTGGLLLSKKSMNFKPSVLDDVFSRHTFLFYKKELKNIFERKRTVGSYYDKEIIKLGGKPFFKLDNHEFPGAYLFKIDLDIKVLEKIKENLQCKFIECSVFYGQKAFFLPCNSNMNESDVKYICDLFNNAIGKYNVAK